MLFNDVNRNDVQQEGVSERVTSFLQLFCKCMFIAILLQNIDGYFYQCCATLPVKWWIEWMSLPR
ncbi:hypothetical protein FLA_3003 [Filimonas lacunae]|nr:hypothetical protein FLA_3003 [Filimonas lacunae]